MTGAERPLVDWRTKGLPPLAEGLAPDALGALGLSLLEGDLMMPAALIGEAALIHNIAAMQAFARESAVHLCPHGKTHMSPELIGMQLAAGAWGMTAATAHQVRIYRRLGVRRIFLANQLAGRADVDFVLAELAADPAFDFYCLVDSAQGAQLLAEAAREAPRPLQLLIECGAAGGRAGVRGVDEAVRLARRIAAAPSLALRGVEAFEGISQASLDARGRAAAILDAAVAAADAIAAERLFADGPALLSAGGSAFLDLCAATLPAQLGGRPVERVIRPGCYVTHDHGIYARLARAPELRPALEVWGVVLSLPEPGLAIVGAGKRDLSFDAGPPQPLWLHRPGEEAGPRPAQGMHVDSLWDQHLSLAGATDDLAVGDLVGFGISHPCATFDRWRALLLVDARYRVTGAVTTLF